MGSTSILVSPCEENDEACRVRVEGPNEGRVDEVLFALGGFGGYCRRVPFGGEAEMVDHPAAPFPPGFAPPALSGPHDPDAVHGRGVAVAGPPKPAEGGKPVSDTGHEPEPDARTTPKPPPGLAAPDERWCLALRDDAFVRVPWADVRCGDLVKLESGEHCPADAVLLWSTADSHKVALQMSVFDGSDQLVVRHVPKLPLLGGQESAASSLAHDLFQRALAGDAGAANALRTAGHLVVHPPHPTPGQFRAVFKSAHGYGDHDIEASQLVPMQSRLIMTEAAVVLVVYTSADCSLALNGGVESRLRRHNVRAAAKEAQKAKEKEEKEARELAKGAPRDVALLDQETGITWSPTFTNVPDDGNCAVHAFWKGLQTLVSLYPRLRIEADESLPGTAEEFRSLVLSRLFSEEQWGYRTAIENQLRLWLQLDPVTLMTEVEDFYTLPQDFQQHVAEMNQMAQFTGMEGVDIDGAISLYFRVMTEPQQLGDRVAYVPLGALELDGMLNMFRVRLQTIKSEALDSMRKWVAANAQDGGRGGGAGGAGEAVEEGAAGEAGDAGKEGATGAIDTAGVTVATDGDGAESERGPGTAEGYAAVGTIDPRSVPAHHVMDRACEGGSDRIVRLCNVRSNHYWVHLPTAPAAGPPPASDTAMGEQ